jgi:hypothetical protein
MDDYMFRSYVTECKCVQEETQYLEIFNYSVSFPEVSAHRTVVKQARGSLEMAAEVASPSPSGHTVMVVYFVHGMNN